AGQPAVDGIWTGTWRDSRFSPPGDGGRPENAVSGNMWTVNSGTTAITVPQSMSGLRFWRNAPLTFVGGVATLADKTLGYEWDEDLDNGARPSGLTHLSSTTVSGVEKILDFGAHTAFNATATHSLTLYRHSSGALVFGAGTVQWSWGLDGIHDRGASTPDPSMQQATVNLLADMGAQPGTLQAGLFPASPSTDLTPPTSAITSPTAGAVVHSGNPVTITGTAGDTGGGVVAGVEVSVDGGATWRSAQGTTAWSYVWTPGPLGPATIQSRAIDDSGNKETPATGVNVSVAAGSRCPCTSLFDSATAVPGTPSVNDPNPVELGVKFKSDVDGFITSIRFYKGLTNTGQHIGSLWTASGTRVAGPITFDSETATGWQQATFTQPVKIQANTTYVASYHSNAGNYAVDNGYFLNGGVDSPPLPAQQTVVSGGNGLFSYGASVFPTQTFAGTNYWVDVVFAETVADATLAISDVNVTVLNNSSASVTWKTNFPATSRVDYA